MNFTSLLGDEFTEYMEAPAAPSPAPQPAPVRFPGAATHAPALQPAGNLAPISESDLKSLTDELRRDARKRAGLVGVVMNRLRGDDLQRRQYATLLRRIDASDLAEEAKLGLFLNTSLNALGFQIVVAAIWEMEKCIASVPPQSMAAQTGERMLLRQVEQLPALIETVTQRAHGRVLKPLALDR